ncbi:aldolase catalytic domain-containing protein [Chitinophaga vietnamensis]|uniref:aldolase catalytic domain-containing protein n=1 Tax=Chitinophaga vietnamensis TaxID=2593957 RepID=UPI00117830D8|nr:aldolase catalytic domain-containing protein [Chitinophaga vietnamensis]
MDRNVVTLLDCTIRDGGYYTDWDFDEKLVKNYLTACEKLPINIVEIGYRGVKSDAYYGEYFYLPTHLMSQIKNEHPSLKFSICIDEKDVKESEIEQLLHPCIPYIHMIRIPVDPGRLSKGIALARKAKAMGFEVCLNVMYLSRWYNVPEVIQELGNIAPETVDILYLVDSFGSVTPSMLKEVIKSLKAATDIPLGFHGHNNMELALANAIVAMEEGCSAIDATFTGMGRGAGNLKTELFLTYLSANGQLSFDLNNLSNIVGQFEKLREQFGWGTNLPYIISGAYSLPQKEIMSLINKNRYSLETIVNNLQHRKSVNSNAASFPKLSDTRSYHQAIIVGGGKKGLQHVSALQKYIAQCAENNINTCLIHSSSRHYTRFLDVEVDQYCCLTGYEGKRLEESGINNLSNLQCVLPPSPTKMGTYIPDWLKEYCYELKGESKELVYDDSPLSIALQLALELHCNAVLLFGFDGYDVYMNANEKELAEENQHLINQFSRDHFELIAVTPTRYQIKQQSLNYFLTHENISHYTRSI